MTAKENIEVTVTMDSQGAYQPLSFRWQEKTFRVAEVVDRWREGEVEHIAVVVDPIRNQHELIREPDGRWFIETSHAQDTMVQE